MILPPDASPTSRTASAAKSAASPPGTEIDPELSTLPPISVAKSFALIEPKFITDASESPLKDIFPDKNAESAISRVEAINAWTFTLESLPKIMPLGLIKYKCPVALSVPKISEGFAPMTRDNMAESIFG